MKKLEDSEWKFNMENQMKEMMASLNVIVEQLSEKPVMSRDGTSSNRHRRGRTSTPEPSRSRQGPESIKPRHSPENIRCFLCNQKGHLRRDCPNNKKHSHRIVFNPSDNGSDDDITGTSTVNYLGTARMIRIEINIQNLKVKAIIDTGAEVTILNHQIVY